MTNYHAFREIDRYTPGAIIEMGFLLNDRYLLEHRPRTYAIDDIRERRHPCLPQFCRLGSLRSDDLRKCV